MTTSSKTNKEMEDLKKEFLTIFNRPWTSEELWQFIQSAISKAKEAGRKEEKENNKFEEVRDLVEYKDDIVSIQISEESLIWVAIYNPVTGKNWKDDRIQKHTVFNDTDKAFDYLIKHIQSKNIEEK